MTSTSSSEPPRALGFFELNLLDNRYPSLHGLRVLAILSVLQFHVTWIFAGEQGLTGVDDELASTSLTISFGMDLFFILSGFLIGSILLHTLEKEGTQRVRRFYVRRIFRTFPSYYLALTALALTTTLTLMQRQHLVYEYLYLTNFISLSRPDVVMFWGWSLALEEQFYLVAPLLIFVLYHLKSDRLRISLLLSLGVAALLVRLAIFYRHGPWNDLALYSALFFRAHTRFDTLATGILLALVHQRWRRPIGVWLTKPFHRALVLLPSLACLWLLMNPGIFGGENMQLVHVLTWGTVTSIMYFGFLLLLLHGHGWGHRILSAPLFRRVGTLGYGVYLLHIPLLDHVVIPAARELRVRHYPLVMVWSVSLVAAVLGSLAGAYVLHILIEKPALRVRQRFAG